MPNNWNAIHLGIRALIDPTEGNTVAENASALVGQTFGGPSNKLFADVAFVTTTNNGGSGTALDQDNNAANDRITFNPGSGTVTTTFDAAVQYNGTLTYTDGSTWTGTVVVFQDTLGNTFLAPNLLAGAPQNALVAKPIMSLKINSVVGTSFSGLGINRQATNFLACFTAGTAIATPSGERLIETLVPGDLVLTADHGAQAVRWIGNRRVAGQGRFAPVLIREGALGNSRDLRVSPQHRMLLSGWRAELLFGASEVLAAACHLINDASIRRAPCAQVRYFHLMFDQHEIITAEGCASESFFPGVAALGGLEAETRSEILALFPELAAGVAGYGATARTTLKPYEARVFAQSLRPRLAA
jgi:hypothetical protein